MLKCVSYAFRRTKMCFWGMRLKFLQCRDGLDHYLYLATNPKVFEIQNESSIIYQEIWGCSWWQVTSHLVMWSASCAFREVCTSFAHFLHWIWASSCLDFNCTSDKILTHIVLILTHIVLVTMHTKLWHCSCQAGAIMGKPTQLTGNN